ncbi:MAG: SBBP repeat-containing protein [Bacteroidales bacterium]|nr:SBBP repeat-containing protein [Bacteroidales bacterium]
MKISTYSLLIFFLASGFFCTSYGQYSWDTQDICSTKNFYSDYFTDVFSDCVIGSNGTILHTVDGKSNRIIKNSTSGCLPLPFIANQGQIDTNVEFYTDIFGGVTVFITKNGEIVYSFRNIEKEKHHINPHTANTKKSGGVALNEKMVGARLNTISGEKQTQTKVNYYKGSDQSKWRGKIPTYERIDFGEIYDGINLKVNAYSNNVEKLFIVEAGADPGLIQVELSGANALEITRKGELEIKTELGALKFTKPVAYQEADGEKIFTDAAYWIKNNTYGFTISNYDKSKELIIDPLIASTFLGGFNMDGCFYSYVNVDDSGFVYATGVTGSPNFPVTPGAYDEDFNGVDDVFISKFSSDMTTLLASTYFGGIEEEYATSLIIDKNGNIFIAGSTGSKDLPVTGQAFDTIFNDNPNGLGFNRDVFIAKFDSDLENLLSSTYLGGYDQDGGWHTMLNTDTSGNIYVGGGTYSSDFPTTPGAFCNSINASNDVFVTIFDNQLSHIYASTLIGSGGWDVCRAIKLDSIGNIYICGGAGGSGFPTTPGAYQENFVCYGDAFISLFKNDLTSLIASTYIGGSHNDDVNDLIIDKYGDIYVAGKTRSSDFPVTEGAYDESFNGTSDIFISKFNGALTKLCASTYLGGYDYEAFWNETGITIDEEGNVYIASATCSDNFPVTSQAYDISFNGYQDAIVSKFDKDLKKLNASTFLGGHSDDYAVHVVLHGNNILINGHTWSYTFPTTTGAYDTIYNSSGDVFISIFDSDLSAVITDIAENNDRILPNGVFLYPNFPNPFHLETNIIFDLSESCLVELAIYDLSGKMVKSLVKGFKEAGHYSRTWDGTDNQGKLVVPGIYVYKIRAGSFIDSKRCIVLRN